MSDTTMTNHTEKNKAFVSQTLEYLREKNKEGEIRCSYCTRTVNTFEFFDERNFVPIQGKVDEEDNQAYTILGSCCLNDARKTEPKQIKSAFVIDERGNPNYIPLRYLRDVEKETVEIAESDAQVIEANKAPESSKNVSVQKNTATDKVAGGTTEPQKAEDKAPNLLGSLKDKIAKKNE